ncbi:chromosome partitioning protein ParB [filamentous cyanobacterium CCP5]|nr:chromosome partitioning protein ParB [filamentous cyanobacterium CCP5]
MARRTLKQAYQEQPPSNLESFVFGAGESNLSSEETERAAAFGSEIIVPTARIHKTFSFTANGKPLRYYYDQDELKEWGETDLKPNGVRTALWVRPVLDQPGEYELVAGLRRLTACELAGITEAPVKVFDWSDEEAYAAAFDENDRRRDFSRLEEVDNILSILCKKLVIDQDELISLLYRMDNEAKGKTTQNVLGNPEAQAIEEFFIARGQLTWKSFVATRLPLLKKPPEILDAIRSSQIDYTKAIEIAKVKNPQRRAELLNQAVQRSLSLTEVKAAIKQTSQPHETAPQANSADLKKRFKSLLRQADKTDAWEDSKRSQKLEKLLQQLEKLLAD